MELTEAVLAVLVAAKEITEGTQEFVWDENGCCCTFGCQPPIDAPHAKDCPLLVLREAVAAAVEAEGL